ncbi:MAG: aspartate ammonia-lyase [Acidobacteria bacterium]|nr:aspartate ammonia-lyase [Acidobacteriota bacterium]
MGNRSERDTLGEVEVPDGALYGAQTARAVSNFPISGWCMPGGFLCALAAIKRAYALAHGELGLLDPAVAAAIAAAAGQVEAGRHRDHFPVDVFQTGSGTSTNMNMNEVLAHLANGRLGGDPTIHSPVHPNDHVNLGQSSNDTIPAALRLAAAQAWRDTGRPALEQVAQRLHELAKHSGRTVTLGRTHLMDAVPTTYGRIFSQWAVRLERALALGDRSAGDLLVLPLGGTAVGTGLGADRRAVRRAIEILRETTGLPLTADPQPAAAIAAQDAPIAHADALAAAGRALASIANDLRLRGSGPFGGLGELRLPAVQPGSSIMPGKINPVIPEATAQACLQIEGLASACRATASLHQLELSHANPMLAWNLDAMGRLLAGASTTLDKRCLAGLEVDAARARANAEASPALATALARTLGYERAAEIAKAAEAAGEPVALAARRLKVLPEDQLDRLLDLDRLADPDR